MSLSTEQARSYFRREIYNLGEAISPMNTDKPQLNEILAEFDLKKLEVLGLNPSYVAQLQELVNRNLEESLKEHSKAVDLRERIKLLFDLNYMSYSPYAERGKKLKSKMDLAVEVMSARSSINLFNFLSFTLFKASEEGEDYDLSLITEDKVVFEIGPKKVLYPCDAQVIVEFMALLKTMEPERQKALAREFDESINPSEADFCVAYLNAKNGSDVIANLTKKNSEVIAAFRQEKAKPEYIAERNKLAMAFPGLVKKYGLDKQERKTESAGKPSNQTEQPAPIAVIQKTKPVSLSMNASSVVRTFEGKFESMMTRLRSKPVDKRFNEISHDPKWENYRTQRCALNKMFDTQKRSSEIASSRQLAVYADFFEYNFASELGDKKQFFAHGVLALAIKDLADKGVAVEDGIVAKAVSALGLNGGLGKMKESKFDSNSFLEKLSNLEPAKEKSPTRYSGIAFLTAIAKGDESAVAKIKERLDAAASATSPQARQTALQAVREFGLDDKRKIA